MAKTLIVGATGHIGRELIKACKKEGDEVHALVRPATRKDPQKMKPLDAAGVTIHEGEVEDDAALLKAGKAVDNVVSAVGSMQIGVQAPLVKAVNEAGVKRFIPSDFGLDPKVAGPGSCLAFDLKAGVHESIKKEASRTRSSTRAASLDVDPRRQRQAGGGCARRGAALPGHHVPDGRAGAEHAAVEASRLSGSGRL